MPGACSLAMNQSFCFTDPSTCISSKVNSTLFSLQKPFNFSTVLGKVRKCGLSSFAFPYFCTNTSCSFLLNTGPDEPVTIYINIQALYTACTILTTASSGLLPNSHALQAAFGVFAQAHNAQLVWRTVVMHKATTNGAMKTFPKPQIVQGHPCPIVL